MTKKRKTLEADDEVGYRKPPRATQFKKGQSGNPKGRPKKSRNIRTIMREKLDEVITVREGNVEKRYTRRDALILRAIQGAFSNDKQMMQFVFKMDEGADEPEPFRVTAEDEAELDALLTSMTIGGSDEDDPK